MYWIYDFDGDVLGCNEILVSKHGDCVEIMEVKQRESEQMGCFLAFSTPMFPRMGNRN